jgi:hypothetical protein
MFGANEYKFDNRKPKLIFGVADPLIMNSGFPVNTPESQF